MYDISIELLPDTPLSLGCMLRAMGAGTFKHYDANIAEAMCLINTRGYANWPGPVQAKPQPTVEEVKVSSVICDVHVFLSFANFYQFYSAFCSKGCSVHSTDS